MEIKFVSRKKYHCKIMYNKGEMKDVQDQLNIIRNVSSHDDKRDSWW